MEIRTLRYFLAVAREENMTRAAEILHVTQPTLSKQLRSLEDELGKKLFTRHSFSIRLTDEGILLRNRAEDLISMADKIEKEFVSLDDISGGELYLGLAESYQIRYLARVIKEFKTHYPNLHYHIALMDKILIFMSLTEFIEFHSIPVKVTINEYVEISKFYSTAESRRFVNGMLDKLAKQLTESGKLVKTGLGLVDK